MKRVGSAWPGAVLAAVLAASWGSAHAADQKLQANAGQKLTVTGRIVKIQPAEHHIILRTTEGKELELSLDAHSQVSVRRQPAQLSAFKEGSRVRVTYEPADGKNRVLSLRDAPVTAEEVRQELQEALAAVKAYGYQQKQEYQKRLEPVLRDLDDRIDRLKKQAQGAGQEARRWYAEALQELRRERRIVREQLAKAQAAAPGAWEEVKAGVSAAWDDLRKALQRASDRLKEGRPPEQP